MQDGYDLQRLQVGPVHNQVRVDGEEADVLVGEVPTPVPRARSAGKKLNFLRNPRKSCRRKRLNGWFLQSLAPHPAALALPDDLTLDPLGF